MSSDAEILAPRDRLGEAGPDLRRWAALVVMLLAGFMNLLDVSIVNIAIPSIQLGNSIGIALMGVIFIDRLAVRPGTHDPVGFAAAVTHALWFQVGAFVLAFLLMLALPARRGHNADPSSV